MWVCQYSRYLVGVFAKSFASAAVVCCYSGFPDIRLGGPVSIALEGGRRREVIAGYQNRSKLAFAERRSLEGNVRN